MEERREQFSRAGLILAALGMAIGTGNIWRFPRILSQSGGGTFLIPWALALFTWSIPLLMVEFVLGRCARRGPVGAFTLVVGSKTAWMGAFVAFCTLAIMFYYSVVTGWCLRYLVSSVTGGLADIRPETAESNFTSFAAHSPLPVVYHLVSMILACLVVYRGVRGGIEVACKILVPSLLALIVLAAIQANALAGSREGLRFLFSFDLALLGNHEIWLNALSQSAWSTGAGWGLLLCYAIYASEREPVATTCLATGIGNNLASLFAATAILPAVFALAPSGEALSRAYEAEIARVEMGQGQAPVEDAERVAYLRGELAALEASLEEGRSVPSHLLTRPGPGLTGVSFIWIPVLFRHVEPFGEALTALFFLALSFAALSSLIAMVELGARVLIDLGWRRHRAVLFLAVVGFLLGIPSALEMGFFENQDWVWGMGLLVSGGFLSLAVLLHGMQRFGRELIPRGGRLVARMVGFAVPVQFVVLVGWWFLEAWGWAASPDRSWLETLWRWLDPLDRFSVGTCVLQWGAFLGLFLLANRWLSTRVVPRETDDV